MCRDEADKNGIKPGLIEWSPNVTIYADVCRPMQTPTFGGKRNFCTLITGLQRFVRVYLLKDRTKVTEYIQDNIAWIGRNTRHKTKSLQTDSTAKFLAVRNGLPKMEVELATSMAYSPQSNGQEKGINRTLMDETHLMLKGAGTEKRLWAEAVLNAGYLQNKTASPTLSMQTAHELLLEKVSDNTHICTFGCEAFVHGSKPSKTNKLYAHDEKGVYIGRRGGLTKVLIPGTGKLVASTHVTFDQPSYPLSGTQSKTVQIEEGDFDDGDDIIEIVNDETVNEQSVMIYLRTMHRGECRVT